MPPFLINYKIEVFINVMKNLNDQIILLASSEC